MNHIRSGPSRPSGCNSPDRRTARAKLDITAQCHSWPIVFNIHEAARAAAAQIASIGPGPHVIIAIVTLPTTTSSSSWFGASDLSAGSYDHADQYNRQTELRSDLHDFI